MKNLSVQVSIMNDVKKAIANTKKSTKGKYSGFHSVYSGFWNYCKSTYGLTSEELSDILKTLQKDGKISQRGVKGGYLILLPEDVKPDSGSRFKDLLR